MPHPLVKLVKVLAPKMPLVTLTLWYYCSCTDLSPLHRTLHTVHMIAYGF